MVNKEKNVIKYLSFVLIILMAVIGALSMFSDNSSNKLSKQLELGEKYFLEKNYEQAIIAFQNVIEIDENNVEAYRTLADIYLAQGNYDEAANILKQGISITQNQELQAKNREVVIIQETSGICSSIINNSNNYEVMLDDAKVLYQYIKPLLEENIVESGFIISTLEGSVGIHVEKGAYYYIYCGDYVNGLREGNGICVIFNIHHEDYKTLAVGEWKNDKPNGIQTIFTSIYGTYNDRPCLNYYVHSGNMTDGLWNGEVVIKEEISENGEITSFVEGTIGFKNGLSQVIKYGNDSGNGTYSVHVVGYGNAWNESFSGEVELTESKDKLQRTKGMLGYSQIVYSGTSWKRVY